MSNGPASLIKLRSWSTTPRLSVLILGQTDRLAAVSALAIARRFPDRLFGPTGLQRDMLVFDEVVERGDTIQPTQSRKLESAFFGAVVDLRPIIHEDAAHLQRLSDPQRAVQISRP